MTKTKKFVSIGLKLIGIVSLILAFSLGGLTLLATWFFGADTERTIRANTLVRVELLSRSIEADLTARINVGRLIAATMQGGFVYAGTGAPATDALFAQNADLLAVWVVKRGAGGTSVALRSEQAAALSRSGVSLPAEEPFLAFAAEPIEAAFFGAVNLLNASVEAKSATLALVFPSAMKTESEADSVAILFFPMDALSASLSARELYANYLVDASGDLVAHPDAALVLERPSFRNEAIVRDSLTAQATLKQMQYRDGSGNATIGSYKRFLDGSLTVVSTVRESEALAGVYNLQRRNFLITVMILCASMFLLFFFSKSLTDPIKVLVAGANRIKGGDFDLRITPKANDEIGTLALSFNDMTRGLAERDKMKSAFSKFVNKDIAERVLKGDIQLGGESKQAAIFFSDIRSFTAISETLTPHEVVDFLNQYMTRMVKCVDANHGVVDKFIGDAIMAVWGVPDSHGNDTANAIDAALEMRLSLAEFNRDRGGPKAPIIRIGCGINTGEVIAGQIGSLDRMEYTCIGDSVNLASRIESINKLFHTDILISEYSYSLVRGRYAVAPMKPIRVKGKEDPQQIFAVLGRIDDPNGFRTIGELRAFLGYGDVDVESIDPDQEEHKYEVVE